MSNKDLINEITDLVVEKKATDVKVMNMTGITMLADYFLLLNAQNKKHAQAIADAITERMKEHGKDLLRENGYREGTWILQDFGDIITHIFIPEEREYYDLDTMWGDAEVEREVSGDN